MELIGPLLEKGGPWVIVAVLLWLLIRSEQRAEKMEKRLDTIQDARIEMVKSSVTAIERVTNVLEVIKGKLEK